MMLLLNIKEQTDIRQTKLNFFNLEKISKFKHALSEQNNEINISALAFSTFVCLWVATGDFCKQ